MILKKRGVLQIFFKVIRIFLRTPIDSLLLLIKDIKVLFENKEPVSFEASSFFQNSWFNKIIDHNPG